jgi:hypothetical protein
MLDDEGFVVGAVDGPVAGGRCEQGSVRGRLRRGRWIDSRNDDDAREEQAPGPGVARLRGPLSRTCMGTGCRLGG